MFRILNLINSKIGILVCKFSNYKKRTFYVFAVIVSTMLFCEMMIFFFSIANYSCFASYVQFRFFDTFQDNSIIFKTCMFIYNANNIIWFFKRLVFVKKGNQYHDDDEIENDEMMKCNNMKKWNQNAKTKKNFQLFILIRKSLKVYLAAFPVLISGCQRNRRVASTYPEVMSMYPGMMSVYHYPFLKQFFFFTFLSYFSFAVAV